MSRPEWDDQFAESEAERNARLRAKRHARAEVERELRLVGAFLRDESARLMRRRHQDDEAIAGALLDYANEIEGGRYRRVS